MRTTLDLSDELFTEAKIKAVQEGISLKELFTRALENELHGNVKNKPETVPLWKQLKSKGSAAALNAHTSGFDGYSGPEWNMGLMVNEDSSEA